MTVFYSLYEKESWEEVNFDFYIPVDLDLDLFSDTSREKFISLIEDLGNDPNNQAYFPYSTPFYYDVAALRSHNWVKNDIWIKYWYAVVIGICFTFVQGCLVGLYH